MGQKTHPLGFRYGVKSDSILSGYSDKDLHGINNRWAIGNTGNTYKYANLTQRDGIIHNIINEWFEEDGYITNKCIIKRSSTYIGIYVDAYDLEESRINTIVGTTKTSKNSVTNRKELEIYISRYIEDNMPVYVQFVELGTKPLKNENEVTQDQTESDIDLLNVTTMLFKENLPCCLLIAKIVSMKRSMGRRRERETLRFLRKYINSRFKPVDSTYGVKGYLIIVKGRIGGSERSRILRYRSGPMPRHNMSAAIDYGFSEVNTVSGKISISIRAYFNSN